MSAEEVAMKDSFNDIQSDGGFPAKIVCYYSAWATYRPAPMDYDIEDIPGDKCTHIIYSFVGLDNSTWGLFSIDPVYDLENSKLYTFECAQSLE